MLIVQVFVRRMSVIRNFPQPVIQQKQTLSVSWIREFYYQYISHVADILQPLNALLSAPRDKVVIVLWNDVATSPFTVIWEVLANPLLLFHPKANTPLYIAADASGKVVGVVLQQHLDGGWQPIACFARKLKPSETRYSTFDRELLAVYMSVKHFWHFVEGRFFFTSHRSYTLDFCSEDTLWPTLTMTGMSSWLHFQLDIRHVKCSDNTAVDALSSIETNAHVYLSTPGIDFEEMVNAQRKDSDIIQLKSSPSSLDI